MAIWLTIWEARTITAHTYDEVAANETAVMIKNKYYALFVYIIQQFKRN